MYIQGATIKVKLNNLIISNRILLKLKSKHSVDVNEIEECFLNRTKGLLIDTRLNHKTTPPTYWFISSTNVGQELKIVYIELPDGRYEIKSAYAPNPTEVRIYAQYA